MGLGDQAKGLWNRITGKQPEPVQPRPEASRPPPDKQKDLATDRAETARSRLIEPGPAARMLPNHPDRFRQAGPRQAEQPKPVEREASKMAYTRTPQAAPTPGGMGQTFTNRTSTFQRHAPARQDVQQDNRAAEKQQAADKAPAAAPGRIRRPGEAPNRDPQRAMQQARAERRTLDDFKPPSPDRDRGITR